MFTRLKALKVEIEHLQLLMDKAKVKLQKEFEAWWAEEASSLQVGVAGRAPGCPGTVPLRAPGEHPGSLGGARGRSEGVQPTGSGALGPGLGKQMCV